MRWITEDGKAPLCLAARQAGKNFFSRPYGFAAIILLLLIMLGACFPKIAFAANPSNVSFTLQGCRNDGTIKLPNASGQSICPDSAYTTGNLGKGWNELDLVPFRLTAQATNAAPSSETYTIAYVVDNLNGSFPGYDVLSTPATNVGSNAACAVAFSDSVIANPGLGGITQSLYRTMTIARL